jgi:uncharacterized protein (TIGR02145 family)
VEYRPAASKINIMKNLFYILTILAFGYVQAQPQKVNYQAVALTAGGQTVKNQAIKLRLSMVDSSATGTVLYTETHQPSTDGSGQFSVFLGGGTATLGTFSSIAWSNGKDKFLKAEADVTGGTNYLLIGTSQIVSVPYALAAGSLTEGATITGANGSQYTLTVGANGPTWQQSSGPGGLNMNYPCPGVPTVTYGGQTYNTVKIGTQCWFKENLNVGTMIQGSTNQTNNGILEKYCYNNVPANCDTFGGLYQWAEAVQFQNGASNSTSPSPAFIGNVKGICPIGWHVPSDGEWCLLSFFLDTNSNCISNSNSAGAALKSLDSFWKLVNIGANNKSGFKSIPGGYKDYIGQFLFKTEFVFFWSSNNYSNDFSNFRSLGFNSINLDRNNYFKTGGFSIRCLKD